MRNVYICGYIHVYWERTYKRYALTFLIHKCYWCYFQSWNFSVFLLKASSRKLMVKTITLNIWRARQGLLWRWKISGIKNSAYYSLSTWSAIRCVQLFSIILYTDVTYSRILFLEKHLKCTSVQMSESTCKSQSICQISADHFFPF